MFVTVTVALGTIAPDWSLTIPVIVAVSCCARAVSGQPQIHAERSTSRSTGFGMT
jgi:hypothetical protein